MKYVNGFENIPKKYGNLKISQLHFKIMRLL